MVSMVKNVHTIKSEFSISHSFLVRFFIVFALFFIFYRQIFVNAIGVERHIISGFHISLLSLMGIFTIVNGCIKCRVGLPNLMLYILLISITIISFAFSYEKLSLPQIAVGLFYYAFGFLFLYFYAAFPEFLEKYKRTVVNTLILIFVISFLVSLQQFLKIEPFFLFQTDDSVITKNTFYGITRVNGLYGNFVDYAYVSYIAFLFFLFNFIERKSLFHFLLLIISISAIFMTSTRAYIFLVPFTIFISFILTINVKKLFEASLYVFALSVLVLGVYSLLDKEIVEPYENLIFSRDEHTQASNDVRIEQFLAIKNWLVEYFYSGLGPGFLLGPNEFKKQYVTDGILFMFQMELGTLSLLILMPFVATLLLKLLYNSFKYFKVCILAKMTFFLVVSNLLYATINSAIALPSSLVLTLGIISVFNYKVASRKKVT